MSRTNQKKEKRERRRRKIRTKVVGSAATPRLSVFRSNRYVYAQIIDDGKAATVAAASSKKIAAGKKVEQARLVGKEIAKLAKERKIARVVFDRGGYVYAGRVKAVADGAREGGLQF